jgi:hypothetical protein
MAGSFSTPSTAPPTAALLAAAIGLGQVPDLDRATWLDLASVDDHRLAADQAT